MSKINVNQVDTQCGSTLTLGSSGKTVTLASGASQSGFGRTGTVDWCTTAKTSPLTVVSGNGYFINTTSGTITVTLPASPSAGDIVAFKDYANTWDTNSVAVCRNGSKINGECSNAILSTESQSVTLIYVDGTKGWQDIHDSTANITGAPNFVTATGGTVTTCGNFKIHTFTSDGTFTINSAPTPANNNVSYMVVAGGGAGGGAQTGTGGGAGGGGAGGFREGKTPATPYTASPLVAPAGLPVSVQAYPISVGAGGSGVCECQGNSGSNSVFSTITSAGGGGGGARSPSPANVGDGKNGGSGGGSGYGDPPGATNTAGSGNTPPVSPPQGNNGGEYVASLAPGGGGGAGAAGSDGTNPGQAGAGGNGVTSCISGSPVARAGGGGGGANTSANGGSGGGGNGKACTSGGPGNAGTANTGGGGGGISTPSGPSAAGGAGGSGIVVIRYKFQ